MDGACLELAGKPPDSATIERAEIALVRSAQAGDRQAFDELVRLYEVKVMRLAMQVAGSEEQAKDLFQEAFLKIYRAIPGFRFQSSFGTWLYRVTSNVCLDYLRKQKARPEVQAAATEQGGPDVFQTIADCRAGQNPEHALQAREISERIEAALLGLSPRERLVFELRHYEGLKMRAVGEIVGTTEDTAKNCLFRATQKLRSALGDLV